MEVASPEGVEVFETWRTVSSAELPTSDFTDLIKLQRKDLVTRLPHFYKVGESTILCRSFEATNLRARFREARHDVEYGRTSCCLASSAFS